MSDAKLSTGVLLKAGNGATPTEAFTAIAEIVSLKLPQLSRNEIDVSNHNEGEEAKILGMLRKGQVTATVNWLPLNATQRNLSGGLLYDILNNVRRNWQVQFPPDIDAGDTWTFPGRVQLFDPQEFTVDAAMQLAIGITIDGAITIDETEET
jgi:hypothetical protein